MKRRTILATILLAIAFTQGAIAQTDVQDETSPICGSELAMAKMPNELKDLARSEAVTARVDELLLYINFNPNGSTVRPGFFGNADSLISTIVNSTRFCPPPLLDQQQKDEIVRLVNDDFAPFNVRVTTDPVEFAATPTANKQMCLITTNPSVIGFPSNVAGVAPWFGIGTRPIGHFAFVFSSRLDNDPDDVAATISHEVGHLLGLGHQHVFSETCGFQSEYHPGVGSGPLAFLPIMGNGLRQGITNWFAQDCPVPDFRVRQNDYNLLNNQVAVRADDYPDEPSGGLVETREITGILERAGDVDFIMINFKGPDPAVITSDNIDLKVSVVTPGGHVLEEFNDPDNTNVLIPSAVGMRYLKIEAAGNVNMSAQFMTGTYRISY